jgi:thiol:disulfide interchange protein
MQQARTHSVVLTAVILAMGSLTACGGGSADQISVNPDFAAVSTHETARLDWEESWESAFSRAATEGKPVLVSFEAEWCVWCKKLDSTTYRDSAVMSLIAESMVPLTLDVDNEGRALSDTHGVESLPTVLVFSPNGEEKGRINGFLPPGQFVDAVNDILQQG